MLENKIQIQHILAFCDLFIGGGGTLNSEACYFGTPTISTRSFISHYDKWLLDLGLMSKADSPDELVSRAKQILSKRNKKALEIFGAMPFEVGEIAKRILSEF